MTAFSSWQLWAVLSAVFAALTAIFAKIGIENINSDFATFIRTIVILITLGFILRRPGSFRRRARSAGGLICSWCCQDWRPAVHGFAISARLKIGQAAQVAPIDKLSVVLVAIFGVIFLGERLTAPNWLGVALIAAGAVLVAYR